MSRETDTPSSGPNGRGGAAYPSGTPPYGTPTVPDGGPDAGRSAAQPEERKTETTLTTRIRINIPGSRPIPPVVVRQPVGDTESTDDTGADAGPSTPPGAVASTGTAEAPAEPGPGDEKTSDWFAPRKSGPAKGGPGGGSTNGAGLPTGSAGGAPAAGGPGAGAPGGARPGAAGGARPGGVVGSMNVPGGSRPGGTNGSGLTGATGGPVAPGHGGGTGSFDVTEALGGSRPGQNGTEPRRDELPYFSENGGGQNGQGPAGQSPLSAYDQDLSAYGDQNGRPGQNGQNGQSPYGGPDELGGFSGPHGPAGPTGGPVTGDGPMAPPAGPGSDPFGGSRDFNGPGAFAGPGGPSGGPAGPGGTNPLGGPGGPGVRGPGGSDPFAGPGGPGGPGAHGGPSGPGGPGVPGPAPGAHTAGLGPGGGLSDDTAILTPQKPAPEHGGAHGFGGAADNVSGHTVTSGIPVVPSDRGAAFGSGAPADGSTTQATPVFPDPAAQSAPAAAPAPKKPKKKGRSKVGLLVGGLIVIGGGVYGAGLLMNHSDVPKGTTVFGVEIGGGTRDDAVEKLNKTFDVRVNKDLKLSVDGKTVTLKPDQAGLQFDMAATVSTAAQSDYNPVSVVGSLFGQHRVVEPVMPVDQEKLQAALQDAAGGAGSASDGTIKFESGKAVAVYGKAGKGIDVARSTAAVEEAYRTQVETGSAPAVPLATTTKQPTISNAEVDRMMKEFAEPAMSANVVVETDAAHSIPLGALSLPKILGVKAVDGKLVETYNLEALKAAYGTTFDGVKVKTATGERDVLPQDVVSVLRKALRGKTTAERTGVIDTNPS
ncbi:hypothetical protein SLINC_5510 [Streptomyces lincolnensis]|uniref:Uncharacterized protein n=1 Tax=Streptomyces lincolnensis TaxID=1915 RepID=A0A1B1MGP2_STRLN|nr:hypothetical protein [Streptomyces lincolnensis]ANS67734.1 hypothetical protein SLINC_5510 [Streptomyces lincolnensis]AXG55049.1 hypothetical protein SLCG_3894 [Streptomyces lincolnensis]